MILNGRLERATEGEEQEAEGEEEEECEIGKAEGEEEGEEQAAATEEEEGALRREGRLRQHQRSKRTPASKPPSSTHGEGRVWRKKGKDRRRDLKSGSGGEDRQLKETAGEAGR